MLSLLGVILMEFVLSDSTEHHPDRVINLPGAPSDPSFPLHSGYLDVFDNETQHKIFYVLSEAIHADPLEAPLLVWFNGGPGASSLAGFLIEHGPYLLDANSGLLNYNDFSWNQYANVLYIETPSGVGFSHSMNGSSEGSNDFETASLNRRALQDFMNRVHSRYANRDFYLTGQSYAGYLIPYLTSEILNNKDEFTNRNFKGIVMINARVDYFSYGIATAIQMYTQGTIPEKYADKLFKVWSETRSSEKLVESEDHLELREIISQNYMTLGKATPYDYSLECNIKENDTIWHITTHNEQLACNGEDLMSDYLNQIDVQTSLNALTTERPVFQWKPFNWQVYQNYTTKDDSIPLYRDIIASAPDGFRILFLTGDTDLVCPPLHVAFGAERIAKYNNMTDVSTSSEWRYLGDFGGSRTTYSTNMNVTDKHRVTMDVLTVRGSGHSVPLSQPDRAFQLINNFISAEPGILVGYSKTIPRKAKLQL